MKYWKISKTEIGNNSIRRPKWIMNRMIELKIDLYSYKKFRENQDRPIKPWEEYVTWLEFADD